MTPATAVAGLGGDFVQQLQHLQRLKERLAEIHNVNAARAVLNWDQSTYMPPGGAAARANQLATLGAIGHRAFVDPETARLLDGAERDVRAAGLDADSDEARLVHVTRRDYDQATRVPADFVEEMARAHALAYEAWVAARAANNFADFAPWLRKNVELARRQAGYLGYKEHPYDALLDQYEPDATIAQVQPLFDHLRAALVPLLRDITAHADRVDDAVLHRPYDKETQLRFSEDVVRQFGYDFARGRLDLTVHPFATSFSRDDVRITTRVDPQFLQVCLMGTMHEAGHGLYEQGIGANLAGTPLAGAASLGIHESQSRLWENVVGRSESFWRHYVPLAQRAFPAALGDTDAGTLYRAFNKVSPSLIRIEADEVTYNLHLMLRFELERKLLEGSLAVDDLPEAWNAAMHDYLGITPPNDAEGVLQDMHWSGGLIGYFPTYTIGTVLSVQFYEAAVRDAPEIPDGIARADFAPLLGWLQEHIYRHGRKFTPDELVRRATGRSIDPEPYLRYLRDKFGRLYGLSGE